MLHKKLNRVPDAEPTRVPDANRNAFPMQNQENILFTQQKDTAVAMSLLRVVVTLV